MAGLTVTLLTAKDALLNTQVQIQTASNNISNADNKSYARQRVALTSNPSLRTFGGWIGTGATVSAITQVRDQFIERRLMNSISDESRDSALASELQNIQALFADNDTIGISQSLGAFWDSWDQLAQNPSGTSQQTGVYQSAQNLAETIHSAYTRLDAVATEEIPTKIQDAVDQVNSLTATIADLNKAITKNEASGASANDLRDQRYQALKDLSELVPVNSSESADGTLTVTTTDASGPVTLVTGGVVNTQITTSSTITGGKLGGLKSALTDINGYITRLNDFTGKLISQVNAVDGSSGGPVFTGTDAATITASTDFLSGQTSADLAARALAMGELQSGVVTFTDGKQCTFSQYLADIQKRIGTDAQQAATSQSFNESLRTQLDAQQQSVSGVSIDEEMVDLLQFQQIYQAAAKVIDQASQLLAAVIAMVK